MNLTISPLTLAFAVAALPVALAACAVDVEPDENVGNAFAEIVKVGPENELCQDLIAGQSIDAGDVCVTVEGSEMLVTITTTGGWEMTEAHLWTGTSISAMPQTKQGAPKIGNFPYNSGNITGSTSQTFSVPLATFGLTGDEISCDPVTFYVAAHAAVQLDKGDGTYQTETGWGAGSRFVERGTWATYFSSGLTCSDEGGGPQEKNCETAFAFTADELSFCNNDIDGDGRNETRWGWFGVEGPGSYSFPIYAGAGQCDISKGALVGTLGVAYDGLSAQVVYSTSGGYTMDATHVYLANSPQDTIAPGQFTSVKEGEDQTTALHSFGSLNGGDIYFSAHAEVCGF